MNGRIYDPFIIRFISPDPYVQFPENSQNYNRYSYCVNIPISFTDPSGFTYAGGHLGNITRPPSYRMPVFFNRRDLALGINDFSAYMQIFGMYMKY